MPELSGLPVEVDVGLSAADWRQSELVSWEVSVVLFSPWSGVWEVRDARETLRDVRRRDQRWSSRCVMGMVVGCCTYYC